MRPHHRAALVALLACMALATAPPAAAGACGPVETVPDEGHHHLVEGHEPPIPYGSTPPTSGWHYRAQGPEQLGVHDQDAPLTEPHQVSVLAADGVVVTYRDLESDELEALVAYVAAAERAVALTPYEALEPGQVALTAWNVRQRCDGLDLDAVAAFVEAHAASELDLTMGGHAHTEHDTEAVAGDQPAGGEGAGVPAVLVAAIALGGLAVAGVAVGLRAGDRREPSG